MIKFKAGDAWQEVKKPLVKANNQWQEVKNGFIKVGGKWRIFWKYIIENPADTILLDVDLFKLFGSPKNPYEFIFINNGVIGSQEAAQSLLIKGFASGSKITVINNGKIIGKGGNGGSLNGDPALIYLAENGRDAISIYFKTKLINNGVIAGGGGGGGGASGWYVAAGYCTGGGGAGWVVGKGGKNYTTRGGQSITPDATLEQGSNGLWIAFDNVNGELMVKGGDGGGLGQDGTKGQTNRTAGNFQDAGLAGKSISDNETGSILINSGTLYGVNDLEI